MPVMITLNEISVVSLSDDSWEKVFEAHKHLGMDTPFPLSSVLGSSGLEYAIFCFLVIPEYIEIPRRFALWCAREVQHLMTDESSVNALDVTERYLDGDATLEEVEAAARAAGDVDIPYSAYSVAATAAFCAHYVISSEIIYVLDAASTSRAAGVDMAQKQIDKLREMLDAA